MAEQALGRELILTDKPKKYFYNLLTSFYLVAIVAFVYALISWSWYKADSVILVIWAISSVCGTAFVVFDDCFYQSRIAFRGLIASEGKYTTLNLTRLRVAIKIAMQDFVMGIILGIILLLTFPFWFLMDKVVEL